MFICCALPLTRYGYTTKRKPFRNPKQMKQRLKFAKEHEHWLNECNNVMWSDDEAHFEVLNSTNRGLILGLKTQMNESFNFVLCLQSGGGLSVYGYMSGGARDSFINDL